MTHPVLAALGLSENESGTYLGHGEWSKTQDAGVLEPINPSNGEYDHSEGRIRQVQRVASRRSRSGSHCANRARSWRSWSWGSL